MSANLKQCNVCNGRKIMLGMGGMLKDCANCHGIGWVKIEEKMQQENVAVVANTATAPKRGRPKKYDEKVSVSI